MKNIIMLLVLIFASDLFAVCNTPISRNTFSPNTVLTSSELNLQFNTVYNQVNDLPGDCIEDGTITSDKLNVGDFNVLLDTVQSGCKVVYNNTSTIDVDKCRLAINGNLVETTGLTNISMGCGSCSAEAASTTYYLYALSTSSGSTLNLNISTTAPDNEGKDGDNRVLGKFFNNVSSDIDQYSIDQWHSNEFIPQQTGVVTFTPTASAGFGTITGTYGKFRRVGEMMDIQIRFVVGTVSAVAATIDLPTDFRLKTSDIGSSGDDTFGLGFRIKNNSSYYTAVNAFSYFAVYDGSNSDRIGLTTRPTSANVIEIPTVNVFFTATDGFQINFTIPIEGWQKQ